MANRAKRVRVSYHDSVPLGDYDSVYEREGTLRRIGTSTLPTSSSRTATDSWSTTTSWTPPDDLHYALDPDGNLYDMALEADVMEEQVIAEGKKKGKKSLVSVRYAACSHLIIVLIHVPASTACHMDGGSPRYLPQGDD